MPELELALRRLGAELDWPPEPEIAHRVAARVREPAPRRRRPLVLVVAAVLAALAVALAVPPARSAILDFFGIGAVEIRPVETLPLLPAERSAPGVRTTLADARNRVAFEVVVPEGYERVYWSPGIVTFVWPDRLLMEVQGDARLLKKVVDEDTDVEQLQVNGYPAVWISGAPHGLFLPGGDKREAGNVLIWVRDDVTFRLEGDLSRERALALAGTLTP